VKAPTWQELCDAGRVLIDQPEQGLAIYPTTCGTVVIAVRGDSDALQFAVIQLSEMSDVANALAESEARAAAAQEMLHEHESAIAAHHLIQRIKGTT